MIFVYIIIIGLPALLIFFILKKMKKVNNIKKQGITTDAFITHISTRRMGKTTVDVLTLEYKDAAGRRHPAKATIQVGKYRMGQRIPIKYLPQNSAQYGFDDVSGYWFILIFCILLFLFALFAVYKINEALQGADIHFTG
jgi:hypothetical protein